MMNFLRRIADAIRREPEGLARIDRTPADPQAPRGRQDHLLDRGDEIRR